MHKIVHIECLYPLIYENTLIDNLAICVIIKGGYFIIIIHLSRGANTMVIDRSYKISAFGSFADIVPDTDTMMFFLESFKEYGLVPSIFQELQIMPPATQPVAVQRVALLSRDSKKQVSISSNRIDFEVKAQDDIKLSSDQLTIINQEIEHCFQVIFEKFNKKATRLALNTESFVVNLNDAEVNQFMSKYTNPISLYNARPLDEWNTRLMVRKESAISGINETFNIITILAKANMQKQVGGEIRQSVGFTVNTDINTIAENAVPRFTYTSIKEFIEIVGSWWDTIISEMG